jgi:hypothetical protein
MQKIMERGSYQQVAEKQSSFVSLVTPRDDWGHSDFATYKQYFTFLCIITYSQTYLIDAGHSVEYGFDGNHRIILRPCNLYHLCMDRLFFVRLMPSNIDIYMLRKEFVDPAIQNLLW